MNGRGWLALTAILVLCPCCRCVQAQQVFELAVVGSNLRSAVSLDDQRLIVTNGGAKHVYLRDRQYDAAGYIGYSNLAVRKALRWPISNRGRLEIGVITGGPVEFGPSQMQVVSQERPPEGPPMGPRNVRRPLGEPTTLDLREGLVPAARFGNQVSIYPRTVTVVPQDNVLAVAVRLQRSPVRDAILFWDLQTGQWIEPDTSFSDIAVGLGGAMAFIDQEGGVVLDSAPNREAMPLDLKLNNWGLVDHIQFSHDGRTLLTAGQNTAGQDFIQLWDVDRRQVKGLIRIDGGQASALHPSGNVVALGQSHVNGGTLDERDGIRLLNAQGQEFARRLGHRFAVTSLAFSPNGEILASSDVGDRELGAPPKLLLWFQDQQKELSGHGHYVVDFAFSPDGTLLATAGGEIENRAGIITIWDLSRGFQNVRRLKTLTGHSRVVASVAFSADGRSLVSVGLDEKLRFWDLVAQPPAPSDRRLVLTVKDQLQPNRMIVDAEFDIVRPIPQDVGDQDTFERVTFEPRTNGDGVYDFVLQPAIYTVTVSRQGYQPISKQIDLRERSVEDTILLRGLTPPGFAVVLTVQDEQSKPLNDATITISRSSAKPEANDKGIYSYRLPRGLYEVTIQKEGYQPTTRNIAVRSGSVEATIQLKSAPTPRYSLLLGVQDAEDDPIRGATLTIPGIDGNAKEIGRGLYEFRLRPGSYEVTVNKTGFMPYTTSAVLKNQNVRETIRLKRAPPQAYPILLIVKDDKEKPIADATITIPGISTNPKSDDPGVYEYNVKPGSYQVTVSKTGFKPATMTVDVRDKLVRETIQLVPIVVPDGTYALVLNIVDLEKKPLTGLNIVADPEILVESDHSTDSYAFRLRPAIYEFAIIVDGLSFPPGRLAVESSDAEFYIAPLAAAAEEELQLKAMLDRMDLNRDRYLDKHDFPEGKWEDVQHLDTDNDNELKWDELRPLLKIADNAAPTRTNGQRRAERPTGTRPDVATDPATLRARLDQNRDGKVNKEDFSEPGWQDIKKQLGQDDADALTDADIKSLFPTPAASDQGNRKPRGRIALSDDEMLLQLHKRMDIDRSGTLDKGDFPEAGWAAARELDTNGDQKLSSEELRPLLPDAGQDEPAVEPVPPDPVDGSPRGTLTIRKREPQVVLQ